MATLNLDYYQNLTEQVNHCGSCERLQQLKTETMASLNDQLASLNEQIAALQPMLALLTVPGANLGAIVTWIRNFVDNYLAVSIKPYQIEIQQLTQVTAQIAQLQQALQDASVKFPNCSL